MLLGKGEDSFGLTPRCARNHTGAYQARQRCECRGKTADLSCDFQDIHGRREFAPLSRLTSSSVVPRGPRGRLVKKSSPRSCGGAIHSAFGGNVDYAQIVKSYEAEHAGPGRYSPPKVTETQKTPIFGAPVEELVSTSYVERQNLTMRMQIRRMTRLTNAFSKKLRNHKAATALHFAHYNFVRRHQTLRTSPAMAAGVTERLWSTEDLVDIALRTGAP